MPRTAPYAADAIILSLRSTQGRRYVSLNCIECGLPILERNNDRVLRAYPNGLPVEGHVGAEGLPIGCRCGQQYVALFSGVQHSEGAERSSQPYALYLVASTRKQLRDVRCLLCAHAFFSVSDQIRMVVDDTMPVHAVSANRPGPVEARCHYNRCKQAFHAFL